MNPSEMHLTWFLRATAVMFLSALGAVVMPGEWMNAIHQELGLGTLPDAPLVGYLTRTLSALYATMGASYWFMSTDVRRYLPLLRFSVPVTLVLDVIILGIDLGVGMPLTWTIPEAICILGWTAAFAWLVWRVRPER